MSQDKVLILMGSDSDYPVVGAAGDYLDSMGVGYRMHVSSAHRSPERTRSLVEQAEKDGLQVVICAAGMAAHLAGVVASETMLPVIGIPIDASPFGGMDAMLATVQMPPGIPVATVAVGKAGATNAAALACRILALGNAELAAKIQAKKVDMAKAVAEKDAKLQQKR